MLLELSDSAISDAISDVTAPYQPSGAFVNVLLFLFMDTLHFAVVPRHHRPAR